MTWPRRQDKVQALVRDGSRKFVSGAGTDGAARMSCAALLAQQGLRTKSGGHHVTKSPSHHRVRRPCAIRRTLRCILGLAASAFGDRVATPPRRGRQPGGGSRSRRPRDGDPRRRRTVAAKPAALPSHAELTQNSSLRCSWLSEELGWSARFKTLVKAVIEHVLDPLQTLGVAPAYVAALDAITQPAVGAFVRGPLPPPLQFAEDNRYAHLPGDALAADCVGTGPTSGDRTVPETMGPIKEANVQVRIAFREMSPILARQRSSPVPDTWPRRARS